MPRLVHHKLERHTTDRDIIHVIEVPPKFWRPKEVNKYVPLEYADDIEEGVFDFVHYGKTLFREASAGRWGIGQNRKFLWGNFFYCVCDCAAVKKVLDYEGSISMIKRWAQA